VVLRFFFGLFIVVPLAEMTLLFEVADKVGGAATLLMVVGTAVVGVQVLKHQGFSTLMRAKDKLQSGKIPAQEMVEGMLLASAGALMLTPGFITDTLGFIFLAGPLRRVLADKLVAIGFFTTLGRGRSEGFDTRKRASQGDRSSDIIIDGEYTSDDSDRAGSALVDNKRDTR
jgi:UPF0716 protein FxsA